MERIRQGKYTPEFRAEAVKMMEEAEGLSVERAAKKLSLPKSSLNNRVSAARKGCVLPGCQRHRPRQNRNTERCSLRGCPSRRVEGGLSCQRHSATYVWRFYFW
jgi:transposase